MPQHTIIQEPIPLYILLRKKVFHSPLQWYLSLGVGYSIQTLLFFIVIILLSILNFNTALIGDQWKDELRIYIIVSLLIPFFLYPLNYWEFCLPHQVTLGDASILIDRIKKSIPIATILHITVFSAFEEEEHFYKVELTLSRNKKEHFYIDEENLSAIIKALEVINEGITKPKFFYSIPHITAILNEKQFIKIKIDNEDSFLSLKEFLGKQIPEFDFGSTTKSKFGQPVYTLHFHRETNQEHLLTTIKQYHVDVQN